MSANEPTAFYVKSMTGLTILLHDPQVNVRIRLTNTTLLTFPDGRGLYARTGDNGAGLTQLQAAPTHRAAEPIDNPQLQATVSLLRGQPR